MSLVANNVENQKGCEKVKLLHKAVINYSYGRSFSTEHFERLLKLEGDINYNIIDRYGKVTNILHAIYEQLHWLDLRDNILNSLLNNGVDFTYKNSKGRTVVHEIIYSKFKYYTCSTDTNLVDSILLAHVRFHNFANPCDSFGFSHFHAACMTDNAEAVQFYLKNGVDVNQTVKENSEEYSLFTPLHFAIQFYCPNAVQILLKYGSNVHLKNSSGYSSLHSIIEAKFKISCDDKKGRDRYERTLNNFVKFFIDDNVEVSAVDEFGFCKLHAACLLEDPSIAESLLARVTNVNQAVNSDSPICPGYTALHFAASCNVKIFELLVKNGADIGVKNASGLTPFDLLLHNCKIEEILTILSIKSEWKNILLSDGETKLSDVLSALESYDKCVSLFTNRKSVLKSRVPVDSTLWPGYTVLHLAVAYEKETCRLGRHCRIIEDLPIFVCLQVGADMTVKNANGSTPLHLAFHLQKHNLVDFLLDNLQPNNPVDPNQLSHFHIACVGGHYKTVEHLLVKKGVDVNLPVLSTLKCRVDDPSNHKSLIFFITPGSTALHLSVARGDKKITKTLLKHGADVNAQDANGFTAVHRLLSSKHHDGISDLLLSQKNLKNITTPCGLGHLHVASRFGHNDAVKKLLKLGADVNAPVTIDEYNWKMPTSDRISVDPYGIPRRPLAFLSNYAGYTPLHFCHCQRIRLQLLKKNADLLAKNSRGIFPLQNMRENFNAIDYSKIINGNNTIQTYSRNQHGITMLHVNCFSANVKMVKHLLRRGADVNAKVNCCSRIWKGYTPLHCVVEKLLKNPEVKSLVDRLTKIGQLLVEHGADVLLENDNHDTPFHMIYRKLDLKDDRSNVRGLPEAITLASLLLDNLKNFNVNPINNNGLSIFHIACVAFHADAVQKFIESGADTNQAIEYFSRNCPESTALHLVIMIYHALNKYSWKLTSKYDKDFIKVVDLLLEHGADINARDIFGDTPLYIAIRLGRRLSVRPRLIEKLISHGADIHAMNHCCETAFELLLKKQKNATWEELELFLNASPVFLFNMYSRSLQGYLGLFFRFHQDIYDFTTILDLPIVHRILDHSGITEITNSGRSIIHNVVSVDPYSHDTIKPLRYTVRRFPYRLFMPEPVQKPRYRDENCLFYKDLIGQLLIRGCDIDQQDNEGKTALHLSMDFKNGEAVDELLRNGADVNIIDNHGKTAFHQCEGETFSLYVYKMKFCGLHVDKQHEKLLDSAKLKFLGKELVERFHEEMDQTKSVNIGNTSLSLYEFLVRNDIGTVYMNMTYEERQAVDQFFEKIGEHNFVEIDCMLKLKYRTIIERMNLLCPALEALNILMKNQLPDLCAQIVMKSLSNGDLKRLIASVK